MNLQRAKKRYRVGKQPAIRSRKPEKKAKEKVKEIDPERVAFLQYLGHLSEEEETKK